MQSKCNIIKYFMDAIVYFKCYSIFNLHRGFSNKICLHSNKQWMQLEVYAKTLCAVDFCVINN